MKLRSVPWRCSLVAAAALSAAAIPGTLQALRLERSAVAAGEVWRLLTCHLVHASTYHLIWDVLPLLALGFLFEELLRGRTWQLLLVSGVAVSAGVLLTQTDLDTYVGLSGVLNGLWVGGALAAARDERSHGRSRWALLYHALIFADMAKIAIEVLRAAPVFTDVSALGAEPVPAAHALGALAGLVALGTMPTRCTSSPGGARRDNGSFSGRMRSRSGDPQGAGAVTVRARS